MRAVLTTDQFLSHHGDGAYRSHVMLILTGHNRSMATGNIHTADGVVAGWLIGVSSVVARRQQQRLLIRSYQMPIQTSTPDYSPSASAAPCVRRRVVASGSSLENGDTVPATDNQSKQCCRVAARHTVQSLECLPAINEATLGERSGKHTCEF